MNKLLVFVCLVLLCFSVETTYGWGNEGHSVIADIAQSLLTTASITAVKKLIPGEVMDQISSVPDDFGHTSQGRWSSNLHYVNMLRGETLYNPKTDCKSGCVVSAIQNYTARFKQSPKSAGSGEPTSFEFVIHFVGDIHQPLHVAWADDLGGNTIDVSWFGQSANLHSVWDSLIISKYQRSEAVLAKELIGVIASNKSLIAQYTKSMNPADWANESFSYCRNGPVYTGISGSGATLSTAYYTKAIPVVKQRLMAAGIRLGTLLNQILGGSTQ